MNPRQTTMVTIAAACLFLLPGCYAGISGMYSNAAMVTPAGDVTVDESTTSTTTTTPSPLSSFSSFLPASARRIIIDLGANLDPILPADNDASLDVHVLAFEPALSIHPHTYKHPRVHMIKAAVSSVNGLYVLRTHNNNNNANQKNNSAVQVRIVGPGGCGQTYLMRCLHAEGVLINVTNDDDGKKHSATPIGNEEENEKTIFVFCRPNRAIHSHLRRWPEWQQKKLGKTVTEHSTNLKTIAEAQAKGNDIFGVVDQFYAWRDQCKGPILFVDFLSDMKGSWEKINEFLDCDLRMLPHLSPSRAGKHKQIWGSEDIQKIYNPIYEDMKKSHLKIYASGKEKTMTKVTPSSGNKAKEFDDLDHNVNVTRRGVTVKDFEDYWNAAKERGDRSKSLVPSLSLSLVLNELHGLDVSLIKTDIQGAGFQTVQSVGEAIRVVPWLVTKVWVDNVRPYEEFENDLCLNWVPWMTKMRYKVDAIVCKTQMASCGSEDDGTSWETSTLECCKRNMMENAVATLGKRECNAIWRRIDLSPSNEMPPPPPLRKENWVNTFIITARGS